MVVPDMPYARAGGGGTPPLQCCISGARTTSYLATRIGILGRTARQAMEHFKENRAITIIDVASAQRAHSKLQKPPHMRGSGSGTAAAATNTQWQERTAADVPRACSSSRPRRLAAGPTDRRFLSACEGS